MSLLVLFKFTLAVTSLTDLLVYQKIADPIRRFFGFEFDGAGYSIGRKDTGNRIKDFFGDALTCFRCTSVWVAISMVVLSFIPYYEYLEAILIVSWVATMINKKLN